MAANDDELVKKHLFALFIKDKNTDKYIRIRKATELNRSMNPTTEEYDYIADEFPTTEVTGYKPSEPVAVKTFKGQQDFNLLYDIYKKRAIGPDAHYEVLTVYMFDKKTVGNVDNFYAEHEDATVTIDSWDVSGTTLTANVAHNGTPEKGYVVITDGQPVFTEGDMPVASSSGSSESGNSGSGTTTDTTEYFSGISAFLDAATKVSENVSYEDGDGQSHEDGVTYTYNNVTYLCAGTKLYSGTVESDVWTELVEVDVTSIEIVD